MTRLTGDREVQAEFFVPDRAQLPTCRPTAHDPVSTRRRTTPGEDLALHLAREPCFAQLPIPQDALR